MEDSNCFVQWALNTLDPFTAAASPATSGVHGGEHTATAFPSLQTLYRAPQSQPSTGDNPIAPMTVQIDHQWASNSGDAMDLAAIASASRTMSWKLSAALMQPTAAARGEHTPATGWISESSVQRSSVVAAAPASLEPAKDNVISERRRRERINQRLMELATLIPGIKKMNKATIIGDAVKYMRELQEKVKTLKDDNTHSTVFVHKKKLSLSCFTSSSFDDDVGESSSRGTRLPEIEVRVSDKNMLVRIHCENTRGLLARVLTEMEALLLTITHTSSMPFLADTTIINITAKLEEGFHSTVEEMIERINKTLDQQ